ncbi:MAG: hypothetical protein JXK05_03915 [Campylobacterales bacterium]|nr:hypothetical protein [Campylobacterales bacterium]
MSDYELLQKAYELEGSFRRLAETTGKSAATWQTLLSGTYKHNPQKLYALIRQKYGHLEKEMIACPAIGEIHPQVCRKYAEAAAEGRNMSDRIYTIVKKYCAACAMSKGR